jgi:hypothetical protein
MLCAKSVIFFPSRFPHAIKNIYYWQYIFRYSDIYCNLHIIFLLRLFRVFVIKSLIFNDSLFIDPCSWS